MPEFLTSQANVSVLHQSNHHQLTQQAEKTITEDLSYPWTIQDLCEKLYVSPRTLRYAFQECLGMSPMAYLKTQRLKQVRRQLETSDHHQTTVTDIAIQCGFWHMGQFSKDYRKMFGECPSETLRHYQRNLERGSRTQSHALTV